MTLQLLRHHAVIKQNLDASTHTALQHLLHAFVKSWHAAEARRKAKEAEKESLFKYKETVHGDESTQEERDQREIKQLFPSFDKASRDFNKVGLTLYFILLGFC
jgi:UV DNA damage repair endonuclease